MVRKDFKLDQQLQLQQNEQNQFPAVDKQEEFHQSVVVRLHDRYDEILNGGTETENTENKLQLEATRVAEEHDFIDQIGRISVRDDPSEAGSLQVLIHYESGKTFDRTITQ